MEICIKGTVWRSVLKGQYVLNFTMQYTGNSNYMKTGYDGQFSFFEKLKLRFLKTIDFEQKRIGSSF